MKRMKLCLKMSLILVFPVFLQAQGNQKQLDSLNQLFKNADNDTSRMDTYYKLGDYYSNINRDSSLFYIDKAILIASQLNQKLDLANGLLQKGEIFLQSSDYPKSFGSLMQALNIDKDPSSEKDARSVPWFHGGNPTNYRRGTLQFIYLDLGLLYGATGKINKQMVSFREARNIAESFHNYTFLSIMDTYLGRIHLDLGMLDSALLIERNALAVDSSAGFTLYEGMALGYIGEIYLRKGEIDLARGALLKSLIMNKKQNDPSALGSSYISLGQFYQHIKMPDSSLFYSKKALETYKRLIDASGMATADSLISIAFAEQKKSDSAFDYLKSEASLKDSLNSIEKIKMSEFQDMGFNEEMRLEQLQKEKIETKGRIRAYAMIAGIVVLILVAFLLYRNNRNRKRANELLNQQKEEIEAQKNNVERTLYELKSTQALLIQSEKMASLGELTAGIAHEIQNPLNFINNFSEVNKELIEEMQQEMDKGNVTDAKAISNDIKENEEKISHHGQRADGIVKGMLQHSRASTGQRELIEINALANEYLRLAYHGLRSKDKSFNATIQTDFDPTIGTINIIPQEIGRVLLNLFNNAFYAMSEKKKQLSDGYEPSMTVSTKRLNGRDTITVRDNGNGIPQKVLDKIFQPFFTTKPAGQGTGLGLSMSYDIIKAHGGQLQVQSKEGEYAAFIIELPA
jgi:two-component system, NtrC family, sensor kinase